jgi:hypothetical protein
MLHLVSLATAPTTQAAASGDPMTNVATHVVAGLAVIAVVAVVLARVSPDVVDVLLTVRSVLVAVVVIGAIAFAVFAVTVGIGTLAGVTH